MGLMENPKREMGSMETIEAKLNRIESEKKALQISIEQAFDSVGKHVGELLTELDSKENRLIETERDLDSVRESLSRRETEFDSLRDSLHMRETELRESLDRREAESNSLRESLERRESEFNSLRESLERKESELDSLRESLERKESELNSVRESLERRESELNSLERREAEFNSLRDSLERRENELNSVRESLDRREAEFNSLQELKAEEMKRNEKLSDGFRLRHEELCQKERVAQELMAELETLMDEIDSDKKSLKTQLQVLAFREDCFDQRSTELELREKNLNSREMGLNSAQAFVNRRWKSYILNKNHLKMNKTLDHINNHHQQDDADDADEQNPSPDIVFKMDGKALQMFLNERSNSLESMRSDVIAALGLSSDPAKLVLDAMEGFYPPHLMNKDVEFEKVVVRKTCIVLLEELLKMSPLIRPGVRADAFRLACEWRFKMGEGDGRSLEMLAFLKLLASYKLVNGWDGMELPSLFEFVAEGKAAPESRGSERGPGLNIQVQTNSPVDPDSSLWTELPESVRFALKPAKLVFDSMQCCYHSVLEGNLKLKVMRSFKTSLMKLLDVSSEIETHVKVEAINFATDWKAQVLENKSDPEDIWCFLLFVITYKSVSCCGTNELVGLLKIVKKHTEAINLFRRLGLTDNFPGYIRTLVERGKQLEAIPDSYEYKLLEMFPAIYPLEGHLKSPDQDGKQICETRNNSPQPQVCKPVLEAEKQERGVEKSLASRGKSQEVVDHEASTSSDFAQNQEQTTNAMETKASQPQQHIVIPPPSSSTSPKDQRRMHLEYAMVPLKKRRDRNAHESPTGNYSKAGLMQEETCQEAVAMPSSGVCCPNPLPAKRIRHLVA